MCQDKASTPDVGPPIETMWLFLHAGPGPPIQTTWILLYETPDELPALTHRNPRVIE